MAQPIVISGSLIRLYVNNRIYSPVQSISMENETGESSLYGINSPYPQEIMGGGQNSVKGSVKLVRTKNSGGIAAVNLRPLFSDLAASNYVSLRLEDRSTGETLWSIPKCKISNLSESAAARGLYSISFNFIGMIIYGPLDLS